MGIKTRKVVIVGAGHVGSHCAFALATQGVCDEIIMVDIDQAKANSQAIDITDAVAYLPHHVEARQGSFQECKDADIVVISAGPLPMKDQTRLDTLGTTVKIVNTIIDPIVKSGFNGIIVSISNPCDVIAHYIWKRTGFPKNRVLGTGTALDSSRLRRILSSEIGIDQKSIQGYSMGEHGDSQMVPWSHVSIGGKKIFDLIKEKPDTYGKLDLPDIVKRTADAGWVVLNGKGSTEFGIGTALTEVVKTIFHDEKKILPCSVLLEGEYRQEAVFASVPVILGKDGVEGIVEINLTEQEQLLFNHTCGILKDYIEKVKTL
jgi:L-lactate dehydrogenase